MNKRRLAWVVFFEACNSPRARGRDVASSRSANLLSARSALSALCLGLGFGLVSFSCAAQQKSVPHSLPPIFSGSAIHSTAPSSLLPGDDPVRNWLGNDNLLSLAQNPAINSRSLRNAPNACSGESLVCYDYARGQARLPIAKTLMPELPGLRKESLSIRRGRLSVNYSF
jgi:hypothetical protein